MATEKRLISDGKQVTLEELLPGTIFAFGDDCIAVKGEYRCANGLIEAFIIDSGEQFWGGAKSAKEQNELMVQPLAIEEVVDGRWIVRAEFNNGERVIAACSNCNDQGEVRTNRNEWGIWHIDSPYCPNCGAKMDGDGNA